MSISQSQLLKLFTHELAYYKTRNAGTQNNGTQDTDGTAEHPRTVVGQREHPGILTEHQRNIYRTPQNNRII